MEHLASMKCGQVLASPTLAQFNALDKIGDSELTNADLEYTGAVPPSTGSCNGNSPKILTDLKGFFGDLFLLGLLTIVLVAWRGFGVRL